MPFFYDRITGQSGLTQYMNYLENEIYIRELKRDTKDAINYQLIEVRRAIGKNTDQAKQSYANLTKTVCSTLENGFNKVLDRLEDVNWRLNDINDGIENLHSMLDWKTDILIEEQKITNLYLGNIARMLKIPDSQKQRSYHVEQGLTYLKNAIEEGPKSDFYTDAFDEFSKAKQIEEKDYFSLQKIGLIHISSTKHFDPEKAEMYFKAAARYAKAASTAAPIKASQISSDTVFTKEILLEEAATSLDYASRCDYIQINKLPTAIELSQQAADLRPQNPEFGFQLAKCLSAYGQEQKAIEALLNVIELDKYYFVKILMDLDFINKQNIIRTLEAFANKFIKQVSEKINYLKSIILENSQAKEKFNTIINEFTEVNYLNARIAYEKLESVRNWNVTNYSYNEQSFKYSFSTGIETKTNVMSLKLSELIILEANNKRIKKEFDEKDNSNREIASSNWKSYQKEKLQKRIALIVGAIIISLIIAVCISPYIGIIIGIF